MTTAPLILGIETAGGRVGCALGTDDGVVAAVHSDRSRRHAESLAPQIDFLLHQAGADPADIGLVAVDVGPGLYTGLRVGVVTGRTMAALLGVPALPLGSLEVVAHGARALADEILVAVDARRSEVFHARFRVADDGASVVARTEPAVAAPDDLLAGLGPGGGRLVVGDGARVHAGRFADAGWRLGPSELDLADPATLVRLAAGRRHGAGSPEALSPCYLRRPDAVAKWEQAS